jgi:tRNA(His) 5'-end guanylyltransferase
LPVNDTLGDRLKQYEDHSRLTPAQPVIIRIDGKSFHTYTRNFERPWDPRIVTAMQTTTRFLIQETGARIGYTQSDEITLILHTTKPKSQLFFDRKTQKIVSVAAAMASVHFNRTIAGLCPGNLPDAYFDARAFTVPNEAEASNTLLWRELDAIRNSVSMLAHHHLGHRATGKKSVPHMLAMLAEVGVDWESCPRAFTHGTHYLRTETNLPLTPERLQQIPEQHRPPAGTSVRRTVIEPVTMPAGIKQRIALIFGDPAHAQQ